MHRRIQSLFLLIIAATLTQGCASRTVSPSPPSDLGVLIMAHGGSKQWDQEVLTALSPLKERHDIEVAFGMADAKTLQEGVSKLEGRGAKSIAVVRLFISGESFKTETEQVLGLAAGAPVRPQTNDDHAHHQGHSMEFWRIDTRASFALSQEGLVEAPEMGNVLVDRARTLSREPAQEDVLIIAHGPGDDAENARWLAQLERRADTVRQAMPFRRVHVETLREDWPEKRAVAEQHIREFVSRASRENGRAIVIPFRIQGFGPYARVLDGLEFASDGRGLVPDPEVTRWVGRQIELLAGAKFQAVQQQ